MTVAAHTPVGESLGRASLRYAQVANFLGPTAGGLGAVVQALGSEHVRCGGQRLLIGPGCSDQDVRNDSDRQVSISSPLLPGSGGVHRVLLARTPVLHHLNAFRPDLLEIHDQTTLAWLARSPRRADIPTVLFAHENLQMIAAERSHLPMRMVDGAVGWWTRRMMTGVDAVVCASAFAARPFEEAGVRTVHRISYGVDLEMFQPRSRRDHELPWRPTSVRLIQVSRLHPEKGLAVALDTVAALLAMGVDAELVFVGAGSMEATLRERIARERLPVQLLGHIADRKRVADLTAAADVALALGPRETFGLSVLEAMAAGTPVVVSNRGASRELIVPGAGLAAADGQETAEAVRELISYPDAGGTARRHAEQFSWASTFAAVHELEAELVQRARERTSFAIT